MLFKLFSQTLLESGAVLPPSAYSRSIDEVLRVEEPVFRFAMNAAHAILCEIRSTNWGVEDVWDYGRGERLTASQDRESEDAKVGRMLT